MTNVLVVFGIGTVLFLLYLFIKYVLINPIYVEEDQLFGILVLDNALAHAAD